MTEKLTLKAPEKRILIILLVMLSVAGIYYFAFLGNGMKGEYNNHTANVSGAEYVEAGKEYKILVQKPADKFYLPIVSDGISDVTVNITRGEKSYQTNLQLAGDKIDLYAVESQDERVFKNDTEIFSELPDFKITVKEVPYSYNVSFEYDESQGRLLIGVDDNGRLVYKAVKTTNVGNKLYIFIVLVLMLGEIFIFSIDFEESDLIKIYKWLAVILGVIYFLIFPPGATNDSCTHIVTLYDKANVLMGHADWNNVDGQQGYSMMKDGDAYVVYGMIRGDEKNYTSTNIKKLDESFYSIKQRFDNSTEIKSNYHVSYTDATIIAYLPYLIVLVIGRVLGMNLMIVLRLMQITGFICYFILVKSAIKLMPYGKEALVIFSLNPIMMQSMISIGYDIIPIGIMFVATAYLIKLSIEKDYTWKKWCMLLAFTILLACAKGGIYGIIYAAAVFMIIGCQDYRDKIKYVIIAGVVAIIAVVAIKHDTLYKIFSARMEGNYAISDLIDHPVKMIRLIIYSMIEEADMGIFGAFGRTLSKNESILPWHQVMFNILIFLAAIFSRCGDDTETRSFNKFEVASAIAVIALFEILMFIIFIQDTKTASFTIDGVQGRYYIPFIPLLIALFGKIRIKYDVEKSKLFSAGWLIYSLNLLYIMGIYMSR